MYIVFAVNFRVFHKRMPTTSVPYSPCFETLLSSMLKTANEFFEYKRQLRLDAENVGVYCFDEPPIPSQIKTDSDLAFYMKFFANSYPLYLSPVDPASSPPSPPDKADATAENDHLSAALSSDSSVQAVFESSLLTRDGEERCFITGRSEYVEAAHIYPAEKKETRPVHLPPTVSLNSARNGIQLDSLACCLSVLFYYCVSPAFLCVLFEGSSVVRSWEDLA